MATIKIQSPATWTEDLPVQKTNSNVWNKVMAIADTQAKSQTGWFMVSLIVQGVFFLPLPAALSFYYGAPVYILFITLGLFFANIITGMSGSGIRTTLTLLALSVLVHIIMLAIFII